MFWSRDKHVFLPLEPQQLQFKILSQQIAFVWLQTALRSSWSLLGACITKNIKSIGIKPKKSNMMMNYASQSEIKSILHDYTVVSNNIVAHIAALIGLADYLAGVYFLLIDILIS